MATNAESSAMAVASDVVVWGLVYNDEYKKKVEEKTIEEFHKERLPQKKSAAKPGKAEENDADGEEMGENIVAPAGKVLKGILYGDGKRQEVRATTSFCPIFGPKERKTGLERYSPRTSLLDIYWEMIPIDGKSYDKANERDGVKAQAMGPSKGNPDIHCDVEKDIFIIDRHALACVERPDGVNGKDKVDIFAKNETESKNDTKSKRDTKTARQRIDDWLLRPRNVLFNVNDPGSLLIYLDLLERASTYGKDESKKLLNQKRTVGFFSGPKQCSHDGCNKWRDTQSKKMRTPAQKNILKHPWWVFADFCPMDTPAISFKTSQHPKDVIAIENISNEDAKRARAFCHAMLNHSAFKEGYSILHQANMFPLLVHASGQCLTTNDTSKYKLDRIVRQVEGGGACYNCGENRDPLKIFVGNGIPKDQTTGLVYLHYKGDEDAIMADEDTIMADAE
ncbi:hypothetical protein F5Y00DRAFT_256639 [Daldinia vernicosa]|uniref:uncharacterized protein n=1 Tax=Daldinia vernicosa TaxID=114800 RepID=UPI00200728B5|nr:uncharacterized protein F5Y00DRAFT_256639 [Daldinia vernicosa]KAI0854141.1 hypothetical protein F5Y00DRAFT_256639 [Daldinia vernicosa]